MVLNAKLIVNVFEPVIVVNKVLEFWAAVKVVTPDAACIAAAKVDKSEAFE